MRPTTILGAVLVAGVAHDPDLDARPRSASTARPTWLPTAPSSSPTRPARPGTSTPTGASPTASCSVSEPLTTATTTSRDFAIDDGTNGLEVYENPAETCTYEADGRQVALPDLHDRGWPRALPQGVRPGDGPGFRSLLQPGPQPGQQPRDHHALHVDREHHRQRRRPRLGLQHHGRGQLGRQRRDLRRRPARHCRVVVHTSDDDEDEGDPALAHNLDAGFARTVSDRVDAVRQEGGADGLRFVYQNVTCRPADGGLPLVRGDAPDRRRCRRRRLGTRTAPRRRSSPASASRSRPRRGTGTLSTRTPMVSSTPPTTARSSPTPTSPTSTRTARATCATATPTATASRTTSRPPSAPTP